jgi:S1-C subfamily serine protease
MLDLRAVTFWSPLVLVGLGSLATIVDLRGEVVRLRHQQQEELEGRAALASKVATLDEEVATRFEREVQGRILVAEAHLTRLAGELAEQDDRGLLLEASLGARLEALDEGLAAELRAVAERVETALAAADAEVSDLERRLPAPPDPAELWRTLVAPVVQIYGESSVGSGVVLESQPVSDGHRTFLLTAWHVVRDVQEDPNVPVTPVPVRLYAEDGATREETARVLVWDVRRDVALLELETRAPVASGARLAPLERLERLRTFEPIYAVGCPLGTEPVPTFGSVANPRHEVDGLRYWMINAPTYIGNSGGGIFAAEGGELVGIFSKIYNHGNLRPTIVPHMGLAVPMDEVYQWLAREGYEVSAGEGGRPTLVEVRER